MAEDAIGEAFIAIRASFDQLKKDMQQVQGEIEKSTKPIQEKLQNIGKSVGKVGKSMTKWVTGPIVAVGGGLMMLVTKTAAAGDEIQKMAIRTGFSTEALSEYKHAAELSGTSLDAVEKAVKRMQKGLLDAERGTGTATKSLNELGLSIKDLQGLSPEQQFDTLAMAIASIEDPTKRAALAQEIFGRAGTDLLPMLDAGAEGIAEMRQEARDLGIVFDQEAADTAAKFNDDMDRLKKSFAGVFMEVGQQLLPVLTDQLIPVIKQNILPLVEKFGERLGELIQWFAKLDPKWQAIILGAIGLAAALGPVLSVLGPIISAVGTLINLLPTLGMVFGALTSPIGLVVLAIAGAIAVGVLLYKNWDKIKAWLIEIWDKIKTKALEIWEKVKDYIITPTQAAWNWLKSVWSSISDFLKGIWNNIQTTAVNVWQGVKTSIMTPSQAAWDWLRSAWNSIIGFLKNIWDNIKTTASSVWQSVKTSIVTPVQATWNLLKSVWSNVSGFLKSIWGGIKSAAASTWGGIKSTILNAANNIVTGVRSALSRLPGIFTDIWNSIIRFLAGLPGKLYEKAKNIASNFWKGFKKGLGISSPSYIEEAFFAIAKAAQDSTSTVVQAARQISGVKTTLARTASTIASTIATGEITVGQPSLLTPEVTSLDRGGYGAINITITGNTISNDYDVDRIADRLVRRLRLAGVKV